MSIYMSIYTSIYAKHMLMKSEHQKDTNNTELN